jgi:hypothetical protein
MMAVMQLRIPFVACYGWEDKSGMKRKTAQHFLTTGGIIALISGGSCLISFTVPSALSHDNALLLAIISGLGGLLGFFIAAIFCIIGLIGLGLSRNRRDD